MQWSSDEQREVRELAREFAAGELRPHAAEWDRGRALPAEAIGKLAELGFFGMLLPDTYGGMGFETPAYVAVVEELAWGEPAAALVVVQNTMVQELILRFGGEELRDRWLPALGSGSVLGCVALAEEGAGSDLGAVRTRAVRSVEGWVLDGEKRWVSQARGASLAVVLARSHPAGGGGEGELSLFLAPTDAPGFQVGRRESTLGLRPLHIASVTLRGLVLPPGALVGRPGLAPHALGVVARTARLGLAAVACGIARAAFEHALAYAGQREQFGQKLREFEGMQFKLADMATRVEAARALALRAAYTPDERVASMARLFASEVAEWVTIQAVQVFGGYGYMKDYPVEKLFRDAKAIGLLEVPNEVVRATLARELYEP